MPNSPKIKFSKVEHDPFADGEVVDAYPATAPQREIWLGAWIGGNDANRAFNECLVLRLEGPLRSDVLRAAFCTLVERHDALRTTFSGDGEWGLVTRYVAPPIAEHDVSPLSSGRRIERIRELRGSEVETSFELVRGPLYRATLVRSSEGSHLFFFSAHHIVCDWWSAGVLMVDLARLYRAGLSKHAESASPAAQFAPYARSEDERARGPNGEVDLAYWIRNLSGYQPNWALPSERRNSRERTYASRRLDLEWDPSTSQAVRELGSRHQCTLTVTLLCLLQIWLHIKTGATDIVIGVPAAGQMSHDDQLLVGHCVHLLPFRLTCTADDTISGLLLCAKHQVLQGLEHRQVTYSSLLRHLPSARRAGTPPLVSVCLNVDKGLPPLEFGDLAVSYETIPRQFEIFELSLNVVVRKQHLALQLNYNTQLFEESVLRAWAGELARTAVLGAAEAGASLTALGRSFRAATT